MTPTAAYLDVVAIAQASADSAAVPAAWPKAWLGGCGRSRSGWSRSAVPRSTRWNSADWRWNRVGQQRPALPRPATGRPDGCGARTAATPGFRIRARSPHSGAVYWRGTHPREAMLLAAPDARAQALVADLAALLKRATRCARAVMPGRWRALAAFRMAVHRATPTAAGWPRSMPPGNGGDACAVMPRHRPASRPMSWATCSRTPSQTGLASSIPAIHCATSWPQRACTS